MIIINDWFLQSSSLSYSAKHKAKKGVRKVLDKSLSYDQAGPSLSYEADALSFKETGSGSAVSFLIGLQSFDGSWELSDEFTQVVGKQAKEFQTKFNFQVCIYHHLLNTYNIYVIRRCIVDNLDHKPTFLLEFKIKIQKLI